MITDIFHLFLIASLVRLTWGTGRYFLSAALLSVGVVLIELFTADVSWFLPVQGALFFAVGLVYFFLLSRLRASGLAWWLTMVIGGVVLFVL